MTRYLMSLLAIGLASMAWAGGPPPVYVVVDKVVLEPSAAPERIRIEGSFVRLVNVLRYEYGKPVEGFVYLSIDAGKEAESRAEWAKWQKAAGTGKVVAVGACVRAGALLTVPILKLGERRDRPDGTYTPGHLEAFDAGRSGAKPVQDLLAFVKDRNTVDPRR